MITKRTVAVCDILGFGKLITDYPLSDVINNALGFFRKTLHHSTHHSGYPKEPPTLQELKADSRVGVAWFSDTVLLYSLADADEDCRRVIESAAWLLFETMSSPYTRVRAGVSYGDVYIDDENGIFVGNPIIEAYKLQSIQNWSGGALAPSVVARIPNHVLSNNFFEWYFTDYPVPLKLSHEGFAHVRYAIDWTRGIHTYWPFQWSKTSPEPTTEDKLRSPDIVDKWINTREFHEVKCTTCRKRRR